MTRISASLSSPTLSAAGTAGTAAQSANPAEAMRRLNLQGEAGRPWQDVVQLDAPGVAGVARALDDEREALEKAYAGGTRAAEALKKIDELLTEAEEIAKAAGKRGVGRRSRRENQKQLDAVLEEIDTTAADARLDDVKLLDGRAVLTAGKHSLGKPTLALDRVALTTLGRLTIDGRAVSLADLSRRGALDMTDARDAVLDGGRRSLKAAKESVNQLREQITTFQRESLRPRLGDVATAMEGLFTSTMLGGSDGAMQTARELRQMMIASATIAAATAADGWDRERALALLT
jgi:hypothetical protein